MRIEPLSSHPHLVAEIAAQLNLEWGHLRPWSALSAIEDRLLRQLNSGQAPFTLVALGEENAFLGVASIKLFELAEHREKMHWLGEVFVPARVRGKGVGSTLIRACITESKRIGLPALHLYTPDQQALYARFGWEELERATVDGEDVSIMCLTLNGAIA